MEIMTSWKEEGLAQGLAQGVSQGRTQGVAQGRHQGASAMALRQLRRRFGPLPEPTEARVEALTTEQLESLGEALLDFVSLADLDAWLTRSQA